MIMRCTVRQFATALIKKKHLKIINLIISAKQLLPVLEQFRATTNIAPIRDEAHYVRMIEYSTPQLGFFRIFYLPWTVTISSNDYNRL